MTVANIAHLKFAVIEKLENNLANKTAFILISYIKIDNTSHFSF